MKKLLIVLAAGLAVFAFAGCGNGQATSEEAVANLANPWEDMKSLEAVEEAAGFTVEIPSEIKQDKDTVYRYCSALNAIEVKFTNPGGYLRKAKDNGDISGDYNEYAKVTETDVDGVTVTVKGESDTSYKLATWINGDFSYCIGLDDGVSLNDMKTLVSGLK